MALSNAAGRDFKPVALKQAMPLAGIADAGGGRSALVGPRGVAVAALPSTLTDLRSADMATVTDDLDQMPVVRELADFDRSSGNRLERLVFNHRTAVMIACAIVTLVLAWFAATRLSLNASFEKMLPPSHPYIQNYLAHKNDLRGLGNAMRVVVENTGGDIFDPAYLDALKQINDELFLTPGVDRAWVKSLWTPVVRWTEVTEEGFRGGPVMPDAYDGSAAIGRAAEAEHRARRHRRQPGRHRLQVEHDLRAAARQGPAHRRAHRLPRAVEGGRREDPRPLREGRVRGQGRAADQGPRHRLRQADRRADRRAGQGDGLLRRRGADRHRRSSSCTRAACAAPRW